MPHKKTAPVTPQGGYIDYQDDRLGRPVDTLDMDEITERVPLEAAFHANQCDEDGCSGKLPIDTTFENFVEPCVDRPRSDEGEPDFGARKGGVPNHSGTENPAPVDMKKSMYPHRRY